MRTRTEHTARVVVIGAGMAGARLAARVPGVTVIGEERHAPYNRVLLAEVLAGRYGPDVIALPPAGVRRGVRAERIDRGERLVHCDDGSVLRYGRLVLATGSNPVLPPLRGLGDTLPEGVHPFRTLDDCLALRAAAVPGVRAVVIGGGLLGVSAARALAGRGARVVLAQQGEHLMERQLDPEAAGLLRRHLEALGVEVHTECRVRGLRTAGGAVRAVRLADGYELAAELTVLACGVRPRTGLARAAGLDVGAGVRVDDELRTSDPYIHAVGDCAEHRSTVYGLAGPALEQADVLAEVLAGRSARYTGTRALTRLTLRSPTTPPAASPAAPAAPPPGGLDLASFGDARPSPGDDVIRLADATRGAYRTVVVRGDRLAGGVLLGDLGAVGTLARTWQDDEPLPAGTSLLHLLTDHGGF
ncbi:FAD-dependent oxidoreductase [Streptomyces sp. BE147]|uniref:NAD(P)/FAD-dependent oxidoreductase n=1 Tax=unclassified Streptomyces TaxID=2593676 RepID=UPI002E77D855|nr:FAD-dependent oxidoreductase [Streptomyces sp. BE147]MEE1738636.1 FAD-dependent oxidoreductase [Streptomyces sp. BE147]